MMAQELDAFLSVLLSRLVNAEAQTILYLSGSSADAANSALRTARHGYDWLAGEGKAQVLTGEIPFSQWQVGAEGVADLLAQLSAFDDRAGFLANLADLAKRTGATVVSATKDVSNSAMPALIIIAVIVVALVVLKVA